MTGRRRRLFGPPAELDPLDRIRQTITWIDGQRRAATARAGAALVSQAQVERALREQLLALAQARVEITEALAAADRAATDALAEEGTGAAAPYQQTGAGLRCALDAVAASTVQLNGLHEVSRANIGRAREVLIVARRSLDAALRTQLGLLVALERAHRQRLIEQARRQPPRD